MAVTIKSQREIELMRESCKILADVFSQMEKAVHPGVSTLDINNLGEKLIRAHGCIPNFLNYNGYPASICVSVNDEVVHGIPHKDHILHEGDIVSLDAGLIYKGYHSDMARTFPVGQVSEEARLLMERTKGSFFAGIEMAKAGNHLYDISNAIDAYIKPFGYGIVRDLVGHGIGTSLHEDPQIPNFAQHRRGLKLCFLTWFPGLNWNNPILKALASSVDLYLDLFRKFIPPLGPFDLSPIVATFVLIFLRNAVVYGALFLFNALGVLG